MFYITDYIGWITFLFYLLKCAVAYPYDSSLFYDDIKRSYDDPNHFENRPQEVTEPEQDTNWPSEQVSFDIGQVGGLGVCNGGDVHVFHRGHRKWGFHTFDDDNNYLKKEDGPLAESIEILMKSDAKCKERLGKDKFYLPHGLTLDNKGHYWLTDVATHQVHQLDIATDTIMLTLGKQFEPAKNNSDIERFCKPSDVAVAPNGDIFVSDGYCNNRIMRFSHNGTYLGKIVDNEGLALPHSILLIVEKDVVCAASRVSQPSRIVCYTAGLTDGIMGERVAYVSAPSENEQIFAITYSPHDKLIYAVTQKVEGGFAYTINIEDDITMNKWNQLNPAVFDRPHDIAVSPSGDVIYVGMISDGWRKIWKFNVSS